MTLLVGMEIDKVGSHYQQQFIAILLPMPQTFLSATARMPIDARYCQVGEAMTSLVGVVPVCPISR
jgi:hypothetical protein